MRRDTFVIDLCISLKEKLYNDIVQNAILINMRQKETRLNDNTMDFLKSVPVYPNRVMPFSLGMKNCNLPTESLLVEDDDGFVFFMTEEDKQKSIEMNNPN